MKARMLLLLVVSANLGCVSTPMRKPTWEIALTIGVEHKSDPFTTEKAGIEFKRPIGGTTTTSEKKD